MISSRIDDQTIHMLGMFSNLDACEAAAAKSNMRDEHNLSLPIVPWGWHQ